MKKKKSRDMQDGIQPATRIAGLDLGKLTADLSTANNLFTTKPETTDAGTYTKLVTEYNPLFNDVHVLKEIDFEIADVKRLKGLELLAQKLESAGYRLNAHLDASRAAIHEYLHEEPLKSKNIKAAREVLQETEPLLQALNRDAELNALYHSFNVSKEKLDHAAFKEEAIVNLEKRLNETRTLYNIIEKRFENIGPNRTGKTKNILTRKETKPLLEKAADLSARAEALEEKAARYGRTSLITSAEELVTDAAVLESNIARANRQAKRGYQKQVLKYIGAGLISITLLGASVKAKMGFDTYVDHIRAETALKRAEATELLEKKKGVPTTPANRTYQPTPTKNIDDNVSKARGSTYFNHSTEEKKIRRPKNAYNARKEESLVPPEESTRGSIIFERSTEKQKRARKETPEYTKHEVVMQNPGITYMLYCDVTPSVKKATLYRVNDNSYYAVTSAQFTDGRNPGDKTRRGDNKTDYGVFGIDGGSTSNFGRMYGDAFVNLEDKPFPGLQVTGTDISERIRAIDRKQGSTNGAISFKNKDARRIISKMLSVPHRNVAVVIEDSRKPLHQYRR